MNGLSKGLALFTFGAVAIIDILSACMPVWAASLIIGSTYIVLIIIALACRKQLFIHPFIKMLSKQITTEEELPLTTLGISCYKHYVLHEPFASEQ